MPYEVVQRGGKHVVRKKGGGRVFGRHDTPEKARAQIRALHANVREDVGTLGMMIPFLAPAGMATAAAVRGQRYKRTDKDPQGKLKVGQRVRHAEHGLGTVKHFEVASGQPMVHFDHGGKFLMPHGSLTPAQYAERKIAGRASAAARRGAHVTEGASSRDRAEVLAGKGSAEDRAEVLKKGKKKRKHPLKEESPVLPPLEEVAAEKPGTNWTQVSPEHRAKVEPLVRHWMSKAHPWQACVDELGPEKGLEAAKRICSVVKDMGMRTTHWRTGGKKGAVKEAVDAALRDVQESFERVETVERIFGDGSALELAESARQEDPVMEQLAGIVQTDLAVIDYWLAEEDRPGPVVKTEKKTAEPDSPLPLEEWRVRVEKLKPGERIELPGGGFVERHKSETAGYQYANREGVVASTRNAAHAAEQSFDRAAASEHPESPGGPRSMKGHEANRPPGEIEREKEAAAKRAAELTQQAGPPGLPAQEPGGPGRPSPAQPGRPPDENPHRDAPASSKSSRKVTVRVEESALLPPLSEASFGAFSEDQHPRNVIGRFTKKVQGLKPGEHAELPDGIRVEHTGDSRYKVTAPMKHPNYRSVIGGSHATPEKAAKRAADASAGKKDKKSIGGARRFSSATAAIKNHDNPQPERQKSSAEKGAAIARRRGARGSSASPIAGRAARTPDPPPKGPAGVAIGGGAVLSKGGPMGHPTVNTDLAGRHENYPGIAGIEVTSTTGGHSVSAYSTKHDARGSEPIVGGDVHGALKKLHRRLRPDLKRG